jgi:hypothetical protein
MQPIAMSLLLEPYFCNMQHAFSYNKKKVIQALRYHFVQKSELRVLIVLVNVFAIVAAILFYTKKIRPEPFLLGSFIWLMMMATFWYFLPNSIYKKASTFKDHFTIFFNEDGIRLENERGATEWSWKKFTHFFESPHFIHLYFDAKSFFIVPKDGMTEEMKHELRGLLKLSIKS